MASTLSNRSIYNKPSLNYKAKYYYPKFPKPMSFTKTPYIRSQNEILYPTYIKPNLHINNFIDSSSSNDGFAYNNKNKGNISSYYSNEKTNLNMSSNFDSYSIYATHPDAKRNNFIKNYYQENNINIPIYNVKVLPTKYLPIQVSNPHIINGDIEFAKVVPLYEYTSPKYPSSRIEKLQNANLINKKIEKNKNNIPTQQTYFYSNMQKEFYSTSPVPFYSTKVTYSYPEQQISSYSTQDSQINDLSKIIDINTNKSINTTNTLSDIAIKESNIPIMESTNNKIITKDIYQKPIVDKNNYIINSPNNYKESDETTIYNSYIHKSPEITYKQNLFSPIQSPLAKYETQSYNGSDDFNIEEMLKLKEENEMYKQQLKELDIYKEKAAEARELRKQVEQLSPIKDKLSEIDSLKSQLRDLNELKAKIEQLERFKNQIEDGEVNEKPQEIQLVNKSQEKEKLRVNKPKKKEIKKINKINKNQNKYNNKKLVIGEILHSFEELSMIIEKINTNKEQIVLNLLYKASSDSDSAKEFHKKCDNAKSTIVLIETDKGKRFGGYTSVNWKGKCLKKKDRDSFIFSLDKMKIYENIKGERAIGCYPKFGPIFLGCQIRIYDNAFKNGGSTFKKGLNFNTDEDYVLSGGERLFKIKEIEVYEVNA